MLDELDALRESLAPRYDVEREIGAGGMARVYLAVEQHPHRRVAVKVLDPELSTRLLRERFVREVDLASKLSHPHIVPIFAAGEASGLFYYVMPYVEGESLRHRLRRDRALPLDDALHIARDVADAMAFAHAQGIVHRDIKPENVLLQGDHAIVADFGIARAISVAGTVPLTKTGQAIGSPGYMSPEQAMGLPADARSDVYSLGCVLFEMLAGEPPVPTLGERLIYNWSALESRGVFRGAATDVARAVKHAISRALAPFPDDRFPTAAEFAAALGGAAHRTGRPSRSFLAGRRGRRLAGAAAVLGVAGVAGALLLRRPAPGLNERRVVVAVIENRTGDPALDNLGHMTADWVTQGLAQTGLVEVVPSISVMASSLASGAPDPGAGHLDAAGIRALGREMGAGTVVSGVYYRQGDSIRFQIQIASARDGKILRALDPVAAPQARPLGAVEAVRQRVMAALATLFDSRLSRWATTASQPPNFLAYQEFIAGLDRFVQFDSPGAEAFQASSAMATLAPASEALYLFAEDAMALRRPRDAVNALAALGPDRGFTRGWWVYWYDLSTALHMLGDHRRELKEALEGARRFPGNPQIVTAQAAALAALGRAEDVAHLVEANETLSPEFGATPTDVMVRAAAELRAHGHAATADTVLARARRWLAARPPAEAASAAHRSHVALVAYAAGRLDDARREFEGLLGEGPTGRSASLHFVNEGLGSMDYLGYLGAIAARQGNREQALRVERRLAGAERPYFFGRHTIWRARIHALLGERELATTLVREALSRGYPHADELHTEIDFESLRDYPPFQELLRPKI
ncbi:MAG: hypothetical protein DMD74_07670 [Gemmatimonadetes bacterium]|nr:MAG: hypothetical protein DMD74_07670 [Gemmatimonadota bacterium]